MNTLDWLLLALVALAAVAAIRRWRKRAAAAAPETAGTVPAAVRKGVLNAGNFLLRYNETPACETRLCLTSGGIFIS